MPDKPIVIDRARFARMTGRTPQAVSQLLSDGLPHKGGGRGKKVLIDLDQALPWLLEMRGAGPASAAQRYKQEQAEKLAFENAERRGELIRRDDFDAVATNAIDTVKQVVMGMPGRRASEVSSLDDPAMCRSVLMDEARQILESFTEAFSELADDCDRSADEIDAADPAAEKDSQRVGKSKSRSPKRKR